MFLQIIIISDIITVSLHIIISHTIIVLSQIVITIDIFIVLLHYHHHIMIDNITVLLQIISLLFRCRVVSCVDKTKEW